MSRSAICCWIANIYFPYIKKKLINSKNHTFKPKKSLILILWILTGMTRTMIAPAALNALLPVPLVPRGTRSAFVPIFQVPARDVGEARLIPAHFYVDASVSVSRLPIWALSASGPVRGVLAVHAGMTVRRMGDARRLLDGLHLTDVATFQDLSEPVDHRVLIVDLHRKRVHSFDQVVQSLQNGTLKLISQLGTSGYDFW